jgi:hypothetical protein
MAVSQTLTLTEVVGSPSVATNTSQVRILWQSTQTGDSRNDYTRTAKYWVAINGGAGTEYSVTYTLPRGTTKTILDTTITVPHKDDGSGTVTVATWMDTDISAGVVEKSQTLTLTTIARASSIDSAANVTLGNACSVKWTPKSSAFRYKLKFSYGSWTYTTGAIHPNKTSAYTYSGYTIPLDVAKQIPDSRTGKMTVTLYTYSDSGATKQVGSGDSETFTVTVPDNNDTKPIVSMTLSPIGSLPDAFAGLYIQGLTRVKAIISATKRYQSSIDSYLLWADGAYYDLTNDYTSDYFASSGSKTIYGYATDKRGHTGETSQTINVIPYSNPRLENTSAVRCDKNGNASESGTYLKITAKRSYSMVVANNVQKNFCKIEYRCLRGGYPTTDWATILDSKSLSSDEITTGALLNGELSTQLTYVVHIRAIDDVGRYAETFITVPTETVYWHRDGERNALGLGKYNEKENAVDSAWDFYMNGNKVTGLPTPEDPTDAVPLGFLRDYIVEQGTSGDWAYRKWSSGLAELWGYGTATRENGYVLSKELIYPFALTRALCGIGTLNSYGGNTAESLPWNLKLAYGSTNCKIWIHDSGGTFTTDSALTASVYIFGRWK